MTKTPSLARDPFFWATVLFFIPITTGMPALLGQFRFMPILQAICLTAFLAVAIRQRDLAPSLSLIVSWAIIQFIIILLLTWFAPQRVEMAIPNGFENGRGFLTWFYGEGTLPGRAMGWRLFEVFGVTIGSLLSGGLIGVWFFVRAINLAAFDNGLIVSTMGGIPGLIAGLPPWTFLRLVSYALWIVLLAEPLLTSNWSLSYYLTRRRILMFTAVALLILALLLELVLPNMWRAFFAQ